MSDPDDIIALSPRKDDDDADMRILAAAMEAVERFARLLGQAASIRPEVMCSVLLSVVCSVAQDYKARAEVAATMRRYADSLEKGVDFKATRRKH